MPRNDQLLDSYQVGDLAGLNWTLLRAMQVAGTFPLPVKDANRCVRWHRDEVLGWLAAQRR